jgi:hypothetical protein
MYCCDGCDYLPLPVVCVQGAAKNMIFTGSSSQLSCVKDPNCVSTFD